MSTDKKKRIIITGADSTARVVAETFLAAGHDISVCDVRSDAVASIKEAHPEIHAFEANMGRPADVEQFIGASLKALGGVDFLINVVGISGPTAATEDVSLEDWQTSLDVNLTAIFLTCKLVIPELKRQKFGGIVNFSTASTRTLLPNRSPYVVSKFAVEGLTRNLARELGPFGIRANAILPGAINNDRMRTIIERVANTRGVSAEQAAEDRLQYISMRTMIEPQELADMIVFLCSDQARHVSGQLIGVDGHSEWEQ